MGIVAVPVLFQSFLFQCFRTILVPFVCPGLVLKYFMVSTGTVAWAGGRDQGKGASEHRNSRVSAWVLPSLGQLGTSSLFLRLLFVVQVGITPAIRHGWDLSAKLLHSSRNFWMERARSWVQEQSKGPFSASQIAQGSFPFFGCPCLVRVSAVEVLLGEILPWGCPVSHAIDNPIEALDEEDQLWPANTQLFYCIINSLVCLTLDVPWYVPWCAGQLLWTCSHAALTFHASPCWISAWYLFSGPLWLEPRASHAPMQKVVLSGFGLQIMQPFQTHLSPLTDSWQK